MKEQDKLLLLKDLCARLPYKPKIQWDCSDYDLLALENCEPILARIMDDRPYSIAISKPLEEIRPYLRPMSSMTEEELKKFVKFTSLSMHRFICDITNTDHWYNTYEEEDWLNSHHFDYRGLIEKGLALKAPEGMYN